MKDFYKIWMIGISIAIFLKLVQMAEYLRTISIFID